MADSTALSPPAMDRRAQRLACRVSTALAAAATLFLVYLFRHTSTSCFPALHFLTLTLPPSPFPRTSCDAASRRVVPPDRRLAKLRSSSLWRRRSASLATTVFPPLRGLRLLAGSSLVLCLAAGAGNAVDALNAAGVREVTGIDLVDFPPLVRRADPHRLPFPDGAFDLVFSDDPAGFSVALFPSRLAAEAERAVQLGGAIVLAVDRQLDPAAVAKLFKRSRVVDTLDITLDGSQPAPGMWLTRWTPQESARSQGSTSLTSRRCSIAQTPITSPSPTMRWTLSSPMTGGANWRTLPI